MKVFASFLTVFLTVCVISFFGPFSFYVIAISYAIALLGTMFSRKQLIALPYLAGFTICLEVFSTQPAGAASFTTFCLLLLAYVFQEKLSFTSPFIRYLLAFFLLIPIYLITFFGFEGFWQRFLYLLIVYPCYAALAYIWYTTRHIPTHERS
jgi:hypothetical protein